MCGITGFTHLDPLFDRSRIHFATQSIEHRGPDQQGVWQNRDISLGARRLRIIDGGLGDQPMRSPDENSILVFNGEIYNQNELKRELEAAGHVFLSACDTEVVLHAFSEWGSECLCRFRGMFALAMWHVSTRTLVLARDRVGIKPLYFAQSGSDLYFGSELKAIFVHPEVPRLFDMEALTAFCGLNYVPGPHTLVQGISKLPPGSTLTWRNGRAVVERYWQVSYRNTFAGSFGDAKEQLHTLLRSSVREHLAADVPLGLWLSGGIDSSVVLHYANELSTRPLDSFSVTFHGREFDESRRIHQFVERYSTRHHELDVNPDIATAETIEQFAYYSDEPNADAGAFPVWFLSRLSAQHVTVALSGEGADELFGGYNTYLADKYSARARFVPEMLRRLALSLANRMKASDKKIGLEYKLQRFLEGSLMDSRFAHLFWNGTFSASQREQLLYMSNERLTAQMIDGLPERPELKDFLSLDQQFYLPDNLLAKVDRMSMAHSLEVRPPFLDHRIVEFAASLPNHYLMRGSSLKHVLRGLAADRMPAGSLPPGKIGLDIPIHDWFRGHLKPLLLDTLTRANVKNSGLFRWEQIECVLQSHMSRKANYGYHLWGLLTLFLWAKRWDVQIAQESKLLETLPAAFG